MNEKTQLRKVVEQFRAWADTRFPGKRHGEWETEYQQWDSLYEAATAVLQTNFTDWDEETKQLLTYAIARDNEDGLLVSRLSENQLAVLAVHSVQSNERDAKWQLAEQMGHYPLIAERENLLLAFAGDADEYVRRIALLTLAQCGSVHVERLAFAAWETGDEYQRIASLHALRRIGSAALPKYLELAKKDGRQYLSRNADGLRTELMSSGEKHSV